jgi:hypothetical protein
MSLQTEMRPKRNSLEEEEPLTPTSSEPRTPKSPRTTTTAPLPKTPPTTRSDPIQSNRQTLTPAAVGNVQPPQTGARTTGSLPRMMTTKTGADLVTQPSSKPVDSLAGYMEKIAMKMKKESFSSVFSTEIPETKKEHSNFFFTEVPEKADKVPQISVTSGTSLNESRQNIYEFIDMPPLKTGDLN